MHFGAPQILNALFVMPLVVMLFFYGAKQRDRELARFTGRLGDMLAPGRSWRKNMFKSTLKTLGVAMAWLLGIIVVGGALGVAIMAPWGRASPDCSIYCVLERQIEGFFSDKPS